MITHDRIINTFKTLVSFDSPSLKERQVADYLTDELTKLGCHVKEDQAGKEIKGNTGNIIATLAANTDQQIPVLLLSAHMDRIKPGRGHQIKEIDDFLISADEQSLGADDLAGVTVILEALQLIKEKNIKHGKIKIVFSVAEELGLQGAKQLKQKDIADCDWGLVFDSEEDVGSIVYQAPFKTKFNAQISGQAAHAGIEPNKGVNAIKIASQAISAMNLGRIDQETTANIGVIKGGIARNVVPDQLELEGEIRSHNQNKLKQQVADMKNLINQAVKKYQGQVEFDIELLYSGFKIKPDDAIIEYLQKVITKLDLKPNLKVSGGGNDANIFNQKGLKAVNMGTGIKNAHAANEKIKKESLYQLVELIYSIVDESQYLAGPN